MRRQKSVKPDVRIHILEVAVPLFAERGLDAVSVRDITTAAGVNSGAISYNFGSKEQLIHEVYEMLLGPLQRKRLDLLDQLEAQAGDGPLDLELVLRALIEPTMQDVIGQSGLVVYLPRLMFQAFSVSRPFLDDKLSEQNDRAANRFINALARATPGVPLEEIWWRYYIIIGGFLQLSSDATGLHRLERLSGGRCRTDDPDRVIEELIAFFLHGMRAPVPSKTMRRRKDSKVPADPRSRSRVRTGASK